MVSRKGGARRRRRGRGKVGRSTEEKRKETSKNITWPTTTTKEDGSFDYDIVRAIMRREVTIDRLRSKFRPCRSKPLASPQSREDIRCMVSAVRDTTKEILSLVTFWRLRLVEPRGYEWKEENYLLTLPHSLDFLDCHGYKEKGIPSFRRNPLGLRRSRLGEVPGGAGSAADPVDPTADMCELLLLEEELRVGGPISQRQICNWCSANSKDTVVCFRRSCRNRCCAACVDANAKHESGERSFARVKAEKKWTCFVCFAANTDSRKEHVDDKNENEGVILGGSTDFRMRDAVRIACRRGRRLERAREDGEAGECVVQDGGGAKKDTEGTATSGWAPRSPTGPAPNIDLKSWRRRRKAAAAKEAGEEDDAVDMLLLG